MAGNGNCPVIRRASVGYCDSVPCVVLGFLLEKPVGNFLRQGRRVHNIGQRVAGQVVHREREAIGACAVAQLRFGLCGICTLHRQIGLGIGHSLDVCQACALLAGRVVAVFPPGQRLRRSHQQGGNQVDFLVFVKRCKLCIRLYVLLCQCGQAGHMGGSHGGSAHSGVCIVQHGRVNVSARRRNFRLQLQVQGYAPGAEIRHGQRPILPLIRSYGHRLPRKGKELFAIGLGDEYRADIGFCNAAHIRQGFAGNVVINDNGLGALGIGVVHLLFKGQLAGLSLCNAPLYQGDSPLQGCKARFGQSMVKISGAAIPAVHIFQGTVQACQQSLALHRRFFVSNPCAVRGHQVIRLGHRVHTGNCQRGILGRGGRNDGAIGIGNSRQVVSGLVAEGGAVGIACSHIQNHPVAFHGIVNPLDLLVRAGGETGVGAQAHIDHIHAQSHRILYRRNDIGFTPLAQEVVKNLHGHNLGIRGHAANRVSTVGRRNAGHMGAMIQAGFGAGNGIGISVGIVIGKGELVIHPQLRRRQGAIACMQPPRQFREFPFRQSVCGDLPLERLVLHIHAAVDDGNHLTVAGVWAVVSPYHCQGVGIFVILLLILRHGEDGLHINRLHCVQGRDILQETIFHVCGKSVYHLIIIVAHRKGAGCRPVCRGMGQIGSLCLNQACNLVLYTLMLRLFLPDATLGRGRNLFQVDNHGDNLVRSIDRLCQFRFLQAIVLVKHIQQTLLRLMLRFRKNRSAV